MRARFLWQGLILVGALTMASAASAWVAYHGGYYGGYHGGYYAGGEVYHGGGAYYHGGYAGYVSHPYTYCQTTSCGANGCFSHPCY